MVFGLRCLFGWLRFKPVVLTCVRGRFSRLPGFSIVAFISRFSRQAQLD
jgi:hypothetical protein